MHRVDHAGHPGGTGSHPSVETRLGVVGVDDVRPKTPEELPQLDERHDVPADGDGPGGMAQRLVTDAPRFQLGHERSGSRHSDHFHAGLGKRTELWPEQQHQAHVDRGDVDELLPDQCAQRARATCR